MRRAYLRWAALAALAFAQPASADTVCDWMDFANRLVHAPGRPRRDPHARHDRAATRVSLAMFEALNAIDRRYESYLGFPAGDRAASQDAAAATAAYQVLLHAFPGPGTALDENYAARDGRHHGRARARGRPADRREAAAAAHRGRRHRSGHRAGALSPAHPRRRMDRDSACRRSSPIWSPSVPGRSRAPRRCGRRRRRR